MEGDSVRLADLVAALSLGIVAGWRPARDRSRMPDGAMGDFFRTVGGYLPSAPPLAEPPALAIDELAHDRLQKVPAFVTHSSSGPPRRPRTRSPGLSRCAAGCLDGRARVDALRSKT